MSRADLALLPLLGLLACAHTQGLEHRLRELQGVARQARDRGAYRCAPEELARSEAHLQFAARELDEGDGQRAYEHLVLADLNARAALRLSSAATCAAPRPGVPEARLDLTSVGGRSAPTHTAPRTMRRGSTRTHAAI